MPLKEIISLQLGHYANYVGTHLWNIQESSFVYSPDKVTGKKEICHDVLYREGRNRCREVTYTPRLIAVDLKGSLRTLKQAGLLYDTGTDGAEIQWPGDVTMHKETTPEKNAFLQGLYAEDIPGKSDEDDDDMDKISNDHYTDEKEEDDQSTSKNKSKHDITASSDLASGGIPHNFADQVMSWTDFLGTQFHPKSVHIIEEYRHCDELHPFDIYPAGTEALKSYERMCEYEDKVHFFTEECDNLQGFHVLLDTHDGFGGLGAGYLEFLEDEFPGKGIMTFGLTPSDVPDNTAQARASRIINSALSYSSASTHSSLFVPTSLAKGLWRVLESPVSFPNLTYKNIAYHTSAIVASALDTLSLPYRLDSGGMNLRDITHSFNTQGRKLASLHVGLPLGVYQDESFIDFISMFCQKTDSFPWQSLSPHTSSQCVIPYMQSVVMRGVHNGQVASNTSPRTLPSHLVGSRTTKDVLINYLAEKSNGNLFSVDCLETVLKTAVPFPQIFHENVNRTGYTSTKRPDEMAVESVPVITSLQSSPDIAGILEQLYTSAGKMNIKKHQRYLTGGLEEDDFVEILDHLESTASNYSAHPEAL